MFINFLPALNGAVTQGVLWGIMALGVFITFRLLNIADLTVDGSFTLGGCVCVIMIVQYGADPLLAVITAIIAGLIAGMFTGILHTFFEIPAILAGILTQISLWSINLGIMGKSNIPLSKSETIFTRFADFTGLERRYATLLAGIIVAIIIIAFMYWFFGTEIGSALRATGNNEAMIRALGVNTDFSKVFALMLSNGLVALSGALVAQQQRYIDINTGIGAIAIGLAAIVIGEIMLGRIISFIFKFSGVIIGSIVYFLIRAIVLQLGMDPNYMKLLSAVLVFISLSIPVMMRKWRSKTEYSPNGKKE